MENRRDGVVSHQSWAIDVKVAFSPFTTKAISMSDHKETRWQRDEIPFLTEEKTQTFYEVLFIELLKLYFFLSHSFIFIHSLTKIHQAPTWSM